MAAKDYANTRYSSLDQINTGNVANLKQAWSFSTGAVNGHEAAPLVVGDTMYVVTPFPNVLYALDLKNGGTLKWTYDPKASNAAKGVACCDVVNRGAAYWNGRIYYNTLDAHTVAVDATTGKEVWKTKLGEFTNGETITMAPIVVKDKVLVGNSGGEMGVRGWITAVDANSGKIAWRAYSTGPDKDVLIGPDFKPFYEGDRGKDLGMSSWPPDQWKIGGGSVWGWISYDPEANLIYHGTGNPGPWNPDIRPGDNKWTCGIFARNPDTGQARWAYQWTPHDVHDWDGINEQSPARSGPQRQQTESSNPCGAQRVHLHHGPAVRGSALCYAIRAHHDDERRRPEDGASSGHPGESHRNGSDGPGYLPILGGRKRLAADGLLTEDGSSLYPAQQHV